MKMLKTTSTLLSITLALVLTGCSSSISSSGSLGMEETSTSTEQERPSAMKVSSSTTSTIPTDNGTVTLAVPDDVKKIEEQQRLDRYYLEIVKQSGVYDSEQSLRQLRREVCKKVQEDPSLEESSAMLANRRYTEEQIGIIIAGSMISQCNNTHAIVNKEDLKKAQDSSAQTSQNQENQENQGE